MADIPLDAKVAVRNVAADQFDLARHGLFISRLDRRHVARGTEGVDDAHRRRQADLKPRPFGNVAAIAGGQEVEIGATRLAGVAELAELDFVRFDAFRQAQQRKPRRLAQRAARVGPQERTRAEQRILEAHPQAARPRLAVGDAL
jgi:hypothetical protein